MPLQPECVGANPSWSSVSVRVTERSIVVTETERTSSSGDDFIQVKCSIEAQHVMHATGSIHDLTLEIPIATMFKSESDTSS